MMKTTPLALLSVVTLIGAAQTQAATFTFLGGQLDDAANWQAEDTSTGVFPGTGDTGIINVDSLLSSVSGANNLSAGGNLIFGGGSTLTANVDFIAAIPDSVTFNDVTLNIGDDIFSGTGNFFFNAGSVTNVDDDFEANAGGDITVNGGTHTTGIAPTGTSNFGAQNNSTMNFLGGTVSTGNFRSTGTGTLSVGGDATLTADTSDLQGALDFATDWTGSLTIVGHDGLSTWETVLTGGATLDNVAIDGTSFAENFVVTDNGQTLALVPEPSSLALLGLGGLLIARRRRAS